MQWFTLSDNVREALRVSFSASRSSEEGKYRLVSSLVLLANYLKHQTKSDPQSLPLLLSLKRELNKRRKRAAAERSLIPADERKGYMNLEQFRKLGEQLQVEIKNRSIMCQGTAARIGVRMVRA